MEQTPHIFIAGAGIVGLSTAYQLLCAKPRFRITVLEKESSIASHQTSRNSGVIHTGVYYKPGSLKAKNSKEGRSLLLDFCEKHRIAYQKKHKLIVATDEKEFPKLYELLERGRANGVPGIKLIQQGEILEIEPHIRALQAILVPDCHIVDYRQVAERLAAEIRRMGGEIRLNEPVLQALPEKRGCKIIGSHNEFTGSFFVNCAGLHSDRLAKSSKSPISHQILPFRGEYYEIQENKKGIVQGLIYPVPDPKFPFLGVHLTPMINGKIEAGPNAVLAFAREGYKKTDISPKDLKELICFPGFWRMALMHWKMGLYEMARSASKKLFLKDLQRFAPSLEEQDLVPGNRGIRAQVVTKEGKLLDDFAFCEEETILHVLNAPSPAATASLSIGRSIAEKILTKLGS